MRKLRIVFFGTPEFAVRSLQVLHEANCDVAAVVTAPDRPKGRGKVLESSEVKKYAESVGISVLQPEKLKDPDFLSQLKELNANVFVVVAFRMLPQLVWEMPEYGTFNLHGSLLPDYRGAAPINWAIINGETKTGVTTFFLKHEIDTGNIILQEEEPIEPEDDAGTLYVRLMDKGAKLVLKTIELIAKGDPATYPQQSEDVHNAPKIFRETCEIDWNKPSEQVRNFIRGLSPYPGAWTRFNDKQYKIFQTEISNRKVAAGEYVLDGTELYIGTAEQSLRVKQLQAEGKRRMMSEDYFKGNSI